MSIPLTIQGVTYNYPTEGDLGWGQQATAWASAVTNSLGPGSNATFLTLHVTGTSALDGKVTFGNDLEIVGNARRIKGGFDNSGGTVANRTLFQSSQTNSLSVIGVIPSGSGTGGYIQAYSSSDPDNSSVANLSVTPSLVTLESGKSGTGTFLPVALSTSGAVRMRVETDGRVLATAPAGLGYGVGSGGTAIQPTDKNTNFTLNTPCGRITTANSAVAAGGFAFFAVFNSTVAAADTIVVSLHEGSGVLTEWSVAASAANSGGYFYVTLRNVSGASSSSVLDINFAVIKGALS
jgi:hypothetical protein